MNMSLEQFAQALELKDWYAVAAIALWTLIWAWKRFASKLYEKIPDGWRHLPPLLLASLTGFVTAWQEGQPLSTALTAAVGGALTIGLGSMGIQGMLKERKPSLKKDPITPAALLFVCGLSFGVQGCGVGAKPVLKTIADIAHVLCVNFFSEQKPGASAEKIAQEYCASEEQVRPFVEELLKAKQSLKQDGVGQEE